MAPPVPTILVTGVSGQVGHALLQTLPAIGRVIGTARTLPAGASASAAAPAGSTLVRTLDLADLDALVALVREVRPAIIVNAAAHTAVDKAETEVEQAFRINAEAPGVLADEAKRLNALLVHYSTDYVFDGSGTTPRREDASTSPLGVYGRSKLAGEDAIRAAGGQHAILRTSWVFSDHGHNFVKTMLRLGAEREELRVVADQIGAPTSAAFLATMTARLLTTAQADGAAAVAGLYHLACAGETSWHGFAAEIFSQARARGLPLKVQRVEPIASEAYPTPAKRPKNSRLDCGKFANRFDVELTRWEQALRPIVKALTPTAP